MKKVIFLFIGIIFLGMNLEAQKKNVIKTNLFSPIIRTGHLLYERALNDNMSLQLGFFYSGFNDRDSEAKLNGWGVTPEFRFYLSETKTAPSGIYLAPTIRYMNLKIEDESIDAKGELTSFGFSINFGTQMILKDIIAIDAFIGPSYNFRNYEETQGDLETSIPDVNGFGIRFGLCLGLAF